MWVLVCLSAARDGVDGDSSPPTMDSAVHPGSRRAAYSDKVPLGKTPVVQVLQRLSETDSLFHTDVIMDNGHIIKALVDSGSMACTINGETDSIMKRDYPEIDRKRADEYVIVGCGGQRVMPTALYDLSVLVYGIKVIVPVLVVPGQSDSMILGSNVLKWLMRRIEDGEIDSSKMGAFGKELPQLLSLLSHTVHRTDTSSLDFGTAKLKRSVTLQPLTEHLVWAKLPSVDASAVGSSVIVEPTRSKTRPAQILVGRVVTTLYGDGWVPVKIVNPTEKALTLKKNAKLVDVSPSLSVQNLPEPPRVQSNTQRTTETPVLKTEDEINKSLIDMGLQEVDITSCEVSLEWKNKLLNLVERYDSTFSRHKMDCGEAKDFVHRIRLMDDKPFRLPYRRVPPCHYEKLRTALNEMEEVGIIKKSQSEYASPLVLVVKPNGDLRICNDFRWLNARTIKDAHPLPHQTDALAALGGNVFFSTMDLTSGFYNVPLHEDDKRYTAFSSPFGLHEYNRMPQGLTNSPATFMRMMMSIFGDKNFTSLLCYLDDLMVFAPSEQIALERLEMVFSRLAANNLKLSPKKCHFLRRSVKFLGHIVCEEGMKTDPSKVQAIWDIRETDLMEADGKTPALKRLGPF
uniref:ribonuclease H n=1 Tax=Neogobius melanostomus TaxID=47308 RepID=A0A8C6TE86_9GOBI